MIGDRRLEWGLAVPDSMPAITTNVRPIANRLPVLDGVRAFAIAFVVAGHSIRTAAASTILGTFGVSVFFVLSGYLITRTMLADEKIHGRLRLGNFYRRRALRIFPAFYCFLLILWALTLAGYIPKQDKTTWLASLFYFRNLAGSGVETGHLWTLSLEEQFYLLWPTLFVLTRQRRLAFIGAVVAVSTLWRAIWIYGHAGHVIVLIRPGGFYWRTDFRLDTFLIGGAFAIADWDWVKSAPVYLAVPVLMLWVPSAVANNFLAPLDTPVTAFVLAAAIAWLAANPESFAVRLLSQRGVVIVGILSYSIYLWQQLFVATFAHVSLWNYAGLALAACASYRLIERPFLRFRDRRGAEMVSAETLVAMP